MGVGGVIQCHIFGLGPSWAHLAQGTIWIHLVPRDPVSAQDPAWSNRGDKSKQIPEGVLCNTGPPTANSASHNNAILEDSVPHGMMLFAHVQPEESLTVTSTPGNVSREDTSNFLK
jgi:hypothetical protein